MQLIILTLFKLIIPEDYKVAICLGYALSKYFPPKFFMHEKHHAAALQQCGQTATLTTSFVK